MKPYSPPTLTPSGSIFAAILVTLEDDRLVLRHHARTQAFAFTGDEDIPAGLFLKWLRPAARPSSADLGYHPFSPNKADLRRARIEQGLALAEAWAKTHEITKCPPSGPKRPAKPGLSLSDLGL